MEATERRENKMGYMPVGRLLVSISLPIVISMTIQALYNVVDSMYVSRISENALTAVSLVFPVQQLIISVATGTGVGINALLSRYLGAKRFKDANRVAQHALFLAGVSTVVVALLIWFGTPAFMRVQTDSAEIFGYGVTYMRICGVLCGGIFYAITTERLLTSTGKTVFTMITQATGAILNIVLDPVLIFGLGPFPEMGIAGAAYATVIGQVVSAVLGFILNIRVNKEISLSMRAFRPDGGLIGKIYRIAVPSIVLSSIGSLTTFLFNMIFMQYLGNSTAAAVYGVYFKLNSIFFMPLFGMNNGLVPIIAYNYGARYKKRIMDTYYIGIKVAVCILFVGMLLFEFMPAQLLGIFNASENMLSIGVPALRIIALHFLLAAFCIVSSSFMQALGSAFYSMANSIMRQIVVLLPVAMLLAYLYKDKGGMPAIWWSFVITEVVSVTVMAIFVRRVYKEKIEHLEDDPSAAMG